MDSIARLSVLFCIFFAIKTTLAAENGYILFEKLNVTCKDPSSAKSSCWSVLDYKIPDLESSNDSSIPDLSYLTNLIPNTTQMLNSSAGEQCNKAGTKYLCQVTYPFRCDDEYIEAVGKEQMASCSEGRKICNSSSLSEKIRDAFFNCSIIASNPYNQLKIPRKPNCEAFPTLTDDPYSCDTNYKVYDENATHLAIAAEDLVFGHKMLKNASLNDTQCEKGVADAICKASIPACSKDQTKVVSILSKQECRTIMGCVNQTSNEQLIEGAYGICDELPDRNAAKPYPLDKVYENIGATSTPNAMPTKSKTMTTPSRSPTTMTTPSGSPTTMTTPSRSPTSRKSTSCPTSQATQSNSQLHGMMFFVLSIFSVYIIW